MTLNLFSLCCVKSTLLVFPASFHLMVAYSVFSHCTAYFISLSFYLLHLL
uniref:Uncharacterized protein n=1 Tax=Octopus bimaculoides TaxID=37653 RepID=A0A0L8FGU7_OCTBM